MNAKPAFFCISSLLASLALCQTREPAPTLTLIGVAGEVEDARWADHRIAHALTELLTDGLFENFVLMEEQPGLFARKNRLAERAWRMSGKPFDFEEEIAVFERAGAEFLAFAHVALEHTPWHQSRHGMRDHRLMRADITVTLTLIDTITHQRTSVTGHATADATAEHMVFVIRDGRIRLGESALGLTTRTATRNALHELIPYRAGF